MLAWYCPKEAVFQFNDSIVDTLITGKVLHRVLKVFSQLCI